MLEVLEIWIQTLHLGRIYTCALMYSRLFHCAVKCHVKSHDITLMHSKIFHCALSITKK